MFEEIERILCEKDAEDLLDALSSNLRGISPPDEKEREAIEVILKNTLEELPPEEAGWVIFWLGAAWQLLRGKKGA